MKRAPGRTDPNRIPGESALGMADGSRVWGDTGWQAGVGSGETVAAPALPLLLAEVAGGNLEEIPNVDTALGG